MAEWLKMFSGGVTLPVPTSGEVDPSQRLSSVLRDTSGGDSSIPSSAITAPVLEPPGILSKLGNILLPVGLGVASAASPPLARGARGLATGLSTVNQMNKDAREEKRFSELLGLEKQKMAGQVQAQEDAKLLAPLTRKHVELQNEMVAKNLGKATVDPGMAHLTEYLSQTAPQFPTSTLSNPTPEHIQAAQAAEEARKQRIYSNQIDEQIRKQMEAQGVTDARAARQQLTGMVGQIEGNVSQGLFNLDKQERDLEQKRMQALSKLSGDVLTGTLMRNAGVRRGGNGLFAADPKLFNSMSATGQQNVTGLLDQLNGLEADYSGQKKSIVDQRQNIMNEADARIGGINRQGAVWGIPDFTSPFLAGVRKRLGVTTPTATQPQPKQGLYF